MAWRAVGGCALACMMGTTQWTCSPIPSRAAPGMKPAPRQAALTCLQGPCSWADAAAIGATIPAHQQTSVPSGIRMSRILFVGELDS